MLASGSSGRSAATASAYAAPVTTSTRSAGTEARDRSKASRSRLLPLINGSNCLGVPWRDNGHNLVPDPPAMITT